MTAAPLETVFPDTLDIPHKRHTIEPYMRPLRKTVGLALSGGGANGMAQIGVLKAFEEENIPVDAIAGTSIGAVVGGLYSTGYNADALEKIAKELPWEDLLSLDSKAPRENTFLEQRKIRDRATIAIRFEDFKLVVPKSLSSSQKLTKVLDLLAMNAPYHPEGPFTTLPISFRAVTTDLVSGKRVTLLDGALSEAMLASSTIPVIFEPVELDKQKLADGGLVANLAVDELENADLDYKIGVDTRGSMYTLAEDIDIPWQAADQTMTILIDLQYPRQLEKADLVIAPDVGNNPAIDFSNLPDLIRSGYTSGKALARKIHKDIDIPSRTRTSLARYKTSLRIDTPGRPVPSELFHLTGNIIRNAATLEDALKNLLETDLFTQVFATIDRQRKDVVFHCTTPPAVDSVELVNSTLPISRTELDNCFCPLFHKGYTNTEGTRALEALLSLFRNKGYPLVDIDHIDVIEGKLVIVLTDGRISSLVVSQDKNITRPTPVMREIPIDTSKAVNLKDIERSIDNLFGTGAFNRVSIGIAGKDPTALKEGKLPLRIRLNEKPPSVLRLGVRYDETYNAQAMIDFRNENLSGTLNSIGGWAKIGDKNNRANLEFNMPAIGKTSLTFTTKLFYDERKLDIRNPAFSDEFFFKDRSPSRQYGIQHIGLATSFGTSIGKSSQLLFDMTVKNSQAFDQGNGPFVTQNNDLATTSLEFTLDTRDDSFLPRKGRLSNVKYSFTPEIFNDLSFWQLQLCHEENIPISRQTSAQLSFSFGFSGGDFPFSERYFLGGAASPYNYRFIGLQENDRIGQNIAVLGANLRYSPSFDLIFPSSFIVYYNAGNVWEKSNDMAPGDFIHGFGAGLNWETPIGPASLTAGKAFRFDSDDDSSGLSALRFAETVFYFNFGHAF